MHEGIWIINQVPVVVSSSSCHYTLHFIWILWRINFAATRETLCTGHKGWFNKAAVPGTLCMSLKLVVAWKDVWTSS